MNKNFRDLTKKEKEILDFLLKDNFPGRDDLLKQLEFAKVRLIKEYSDNWGSLEFLVETNLTAKVQERIPVQATSYDIDGVPIQIFLHVVEGKINELEVVKADNSPIINPIDLSNTHIDSVTIQM